MKIEKSTTIDRPVAEVWRWYAVEHVRNHPRWDPDMELEQMTDGPIGLGTKIRRRNVRWGEPVEGEMEVVEWVPEHAMAMRIHDANMEMHGRVGLRSDGPDRTILTIVTDIPGLDESKADFLSAKMDRTIGNVKRLVEAET